MKNVLALLTAGCLGSALLVLAETPVAATPERTAGPPDRSAESKIQVLRDEDGRPTSLLPMGGGVLAEARPGPRGAAALAFLHKNAKLYGASPADLASFTVEDSITDPSGVTYVTLSQRQHGLRVDRAPLQFTFDRLGRLVYAAGGFASGLDATTAGADSLDAPGAVAKALGHVGVRVRTAPQLKRRDGAVQFFANEATGNAVRNTAEKVVVAVENGKDQVAWRTYVEDAQGDGAYVVVDASDGRVLSEQSTVADNEPHGTVYAWEHPLNSGPREVVEFTGVNGSWVSGTETSGNNVDAYEDRDENDSPDAGSRASTPGSGDPGYQHFDFAFTDDWAANGGTGDRDATVTQMFYHTNTMHNFLYSLGFTEQWRNFQVDNFGRGGNGNDPVKAEARDGYGDGSQKLCFDSNGTPILCRNNANFGTPGDGVSPRMQMYLWTTPNRDGALDGDVIAHEYGHGLSNRLVGGGNLGFTLEARSLGEGWSDTVSFMHFQDAVIGEYASGNANGIRSMPYDSYTNGYEAYSTSNGPHANGELWAATLYNVMRRLQLRYGTVDGLVKFRQAVVDGMKNTAGPGTYPGARDGFLVGLRNLNNGQHTDECLAWLGFSGFGLGVTATSGGGENYDMPADCSLESPTAVLATPGSTTEGGAAVTLDATGSSLGARDYSGPLSLAWDLDADGAYDDATGPTASFAAPGNDGSYPVAVQASSPSGLSDVATGTVVVANAAPVVSSASMAGGGEGSALTFALTAKDAGWLDPLQAVVDWGDGSTDTTLTSVLENTKPDASLTSTTTHVYDDDGNYTVSYCVADDDTSTCGTLTVLVTNVAPTVALTPLAITNEGTGLVIKGSFSDPGRLDTHTASINAGDGKGPQSVAVTKVEGPPGSPDTGTFELTVPYGTDGSFAVTARVLDNDGGVGTASGTASILNVAPSLTATLFGGATEGALATMLVSGSDPGWLDALKAGTDWGDGGGTQLLAQVTENNRPDATLTASGTRSYGDNGTYAIKTCVSDDDTSTCDDKSLTVANVAPAVTLEPVGNLLEGASTTLTASFSDPGWLDTQTATIDPGDGSGPRAVTISRVEGVGGAPDKGTFVLPAAYGRDGAYTVTATAVDDDGAVGTATMVINVTNAAPTVDPTLSGPATEGALVTLAAKIVDPGWLDPLSGTVNWGDGSATEALTGPQEHVKPDGVFTAGATHRYGDNGTYTVTICGSDDDATTCITRTYVVANVAPSVTVKPLASIAEGGSTLIQGSFSDPGWLDTQSASIDPGDGKGSRTVPITRVEGGPGVPDTGTFSLSVAYGDNGTYPVTVKVTDDDGGIGAASTSQIVTNVAPNLVLDRSRAMTVRGVQTIVTDVDEVVPFSSSTTDPGSDDLTVTWDWGDGAPSPDETTVSRVNPPGADPAGSPSLQPRSITSATTHQFGLGCTYTVVNRVTDDDGGTDSESVHVTVLDDREYARNQAEWYSEYAHPGQRPGSGSLDQTDAELACYLQVVRLFSHRFSTVRPVLALLDAAKVLAAPVFDNRKQLDASILSGWLDIADGSIPPGRGINTDGTPGADISFANYLREAEAVAADPSAPGTRLRSYKSKIDATIAADVIGEIGEDLLPW